MIIYRGNCKEFFMDYVTEDCSYTKLLISKQHNIILCGTSRGSIRTHLWPPSLNEKSINGFKKDQTVTSLQYYEFSAHLYPINHLVMTPDFTQLITASTDGMMLILKVCPNSEHMEGNEQKQMIDEKGGISQTINDLFIVKKTKLKEQNDLIKKLQYEVARLTQALKVECGKLTEHYREKMRKMDENYENNKKENERIKDNFVDKANQNFRAKEKEYYGLKENHEDVKKNLQSKTQEIVRK